MLLGRLLAVRVKKSYFSHQKASKPMNIVVFHCIFIENMKHSHFGQWGIQNYYSLEPEFHKKSPDLAFSDTLKKTDQISTHNSEK